MFSLRHLCASAIASSMLEYATPMLMIVCLLATSAFCV